MSTTTTGMQSGTSDTPTTPASDTSDAALNADAANIDGQMNDLNSDSANSNPSAQ